MTSIKDESITDGDSSPRAPFLIYTAISVVSAVSAISVLQFVQKRNFARKKSERDESLERFCGVLRLLPDEEWAFVQSRLDQFLIGGQIADDGADEQSEEAEAITRGEEKTIQGKEQAAVLCTNQAPGTPVAASTAMAVTQAITQIPSTTSAPVRAEDKPELKRFRMMLKVGINPEAVKVKMLAEGLNPDDIFGSIPSPPPAPAAPPPVQPMVAQQAPASVPELARFRTMLKVGIDPEAVKLKMVGEGLDPQLLFGTEQKSVAVPTVKREEPVMAFGMATIPLDRLNADSLWVKQDTTVDQPIQDITKKIESLFKAPAKDDTKARKSISKNKNQTYQDENQPPVQTKGSKKMGGTGVGNTDGSLARATKTLIPARRAQNLQIGFAKFKLDPEKICEGVIRMEPEVFGRKDDDNLQLLLRLLPTDEEMTMMRDFHGEEATLSDVERLFRILALRVPDAKVRVESMIFAVKFPVAVKDFQTEIDVIRRACTLVMDSQAVAALLRTVLLVGLSINGVAWSAKAGAISIHNLADRLAKTKTPDGRMTAVDIVAGCFKSSFLQDGDSKSSKNALPLIEPGFAQFPSLTMLDNEWRELQKGIERRSKLKDESSTSFVTTANVQLNRLSVGLSDLRMQYSRVLAHFGEPNDRPLNVFFQDISALIGSVQAALVTSKFTLAAS